MTNELSDIEILHREILRNRNIRLKKKSDYVDADDKFFCLDHGDYISPTVEYRQFAYKNNDD